MHCICWLRLTIPYNGRVLLHRERRGTYERASITCLSFAVAACAVPADPTRVEAQNDTSYSQTIVGPRDIVSLIGPAFLLALPEITGIHNDSVLCVPCDRSSVPFFDRWVIAPTRRSAGTASDFVRVGIAAVTWLKLVDEGPRGHAGIVASMESLLWAKGTVHLVKALVGRKRPVLYTDSGIEVAHVGSNQRSWPSGHAATAAALATSYCLTRRDLSGTGRVDWRCWLAAAGAVAVGTLRMAAAKHYPSDVLSGWAAGVGTAFAVHAIKF